MSMVWFEDGVLLLTTARTAYSAYLGDDDIPIHTYWGPIIGSRRRQAAR